MAESDRRCVRCVLPATFPGVRFDADGVCQYCREAPSLDDVRLRRAELRVQLAEAIEQNRGASEWDCVVAFSGGKDSSFTLRHLVREHGLRCLAVLVDNGFVADQARRNAHAVTKALGVELQIFTPEPAFMRTLYRRSATDDAVHTPAAIKRASGMCNACINLINAHVFRRALQLRAPLIAGGYLGGQVPRDTAVLVLDAQAHAAARQASVARYVEHFGPEARAYFETAAPAGANASRRIVILNPMLALEETEDEVVAAIRELGWQPVTDVGMNSSNCRLNDLGIVLHHRRHHFHPYELEMSELVRSGLMTRERALRKISAIPALADVAPQAAQIGIDLTQV